MTIKASGRSALILAAGLLMCFAGPSQAAPNASAKSEAAAGASAESKKYTRQGSRHWKRYAQRKSSKTALKSSTASKSAEIAEDDSDRVTAIPPLVANANAQLASAEAPPDSPRAMSAKASTMLLAAADKAGDGQVVAPDQLNDVDRALQEAKPPAQTMAAAEAPAPSPAPARPAAASSSESTWDQTSLIGKIFIGFGALLTMASAARMFMA
jgi:hypothetical protein